MNPSVLHLVGGRGVHIYNYISQTKKQQNGSLNGYQSHNFDIPTLTWPHNEDAARSCARLKQKDYFHMLQWK